MTFIPFLLTGLKTISETPVQNPPAPGVPPPPPGFPIDDHIWILVVAGLFLGIYYLKKRISVAA